MAVFLFEGPAGSGKTTALVEEVARVAGAGALAQDKRLLALTKMHGSRRRMHEKLQAEDCLRGSFDCTVLDAFARQLVGRWRSLASIMHSTADPIELDFAGTCDLAGALLERPEVLRWVGRTYRLLLVDELQDSGPGQLRVIRALSAGLDCYLAGDGFQELSAQGENQALAWARTVGEVRELTTIHRTDTADILNVAIALRQGTDVCDGKRCKVLQAQNHNIAAKFLANNLTWWWRFGEEIVVLSATRPQKSKFVQETFARLASGPFIKKGEKPVGPFTVPWEDSLDDECEKASAALRIGEDNDAVVALDALGKDATNGLAAEVLERLVARRRLGGDATVTCGEVRELVARLAQARRAHRRGSRSRVRAMTIHQAKNREFENVIVLWPFQIAGGAERHRRLLYNAVTRARKRVLVVVQDPKRDRISKAPFVGERA